MIAPLTAPSPEKAWVSFSARAALAGYTTTKNAVRWIVVGRYGHTTSLNTLTEAQAWLERTMTGGRP